MEIKVISAASPRFSNKENTSIDLEVEFSHLKEYGSIPFTSVKGESGYTGELFDDAIKGKYGKVEDWVDNTLEFRLQLAKERQTNCLIEATSLISTLVDKIEIRGETEESLSRLKALKNYRLDIMELSDDPKWPNVEFPELP